MSDIVLVLSEALCHDIRAMFINHAQMRHGILNHIMLLMMHYPFAPCNVCFSSMFLLIVVILLPNTLLIVLSGANKVFFELPALSEDLRSSLKTQEQDGIAILIFNEVKFGHREKYICHAVGSHGTEKIGVIELKIKLSQGKHYEKCLCIAVILMCMLSVILISQQT